MRRTKPHDPGEGPPLLTRAEARRFFRVTNATLDRWVKNGKIAEALRVPSAPPRRRTSLVLYAIQDGTLRTRLTRRLEDSPGEVLAVQLLPDTVQVEVAKVRKAQAPRAHQRRRHPGRTAIQDLHGVFHRQPERREPDLGAAPILVAGAEPRPLLRDEATPVDLPPMPQPDAGAAAAEPVPSPSMTVAAPAERTAAGPRQDEPARDVAPDEPAVAGAPGPAAAAAAPVLVSAAPAAAPAAAAPPAIATLMADAELEMLFGEQAPAAEPTPAPADADAARQPSGEEVIRTLTEQIAGLRTELQWSDHHHASGEPSSLRTHAPLAAPVAAACAAPATLPSPSLVAGSLALLMVWPIVLWLRSGDLFWALAALVFANLAACTALLCSRPRP